MNTLHLVTWTVITVPLLSLYVCRQLDRMRARGWIATDLTV